MGQQVGVGGAADEPTGAETAGDGGAGACPVPCPVRGLRVEPAGVAWSQQDKGLQSCRGDLNRSRTLPDAGQSASLLPAS